MSVFEKVGGDGTRGESEPVSAAPEDPRAAGDDGDGDAAAAAADGESGENRDEDTAVATEASQDTRDSKKRKRKKKASGKVDLRASGPKNERLARTTSVPVSVARKEIKKYCKRVGAPASTATVVASEYVVAEAIECAISLARKMRKTSGDGGSGRIRVALQDVLSALRSDGELRRTVGNLSVHTARPFRRDHPKELGQLRKRARA